MYSRLLRGVLNFKKLKYAPFPAKFGCAFEVKMLGLKSVIEIKLKLQPGVLLYILHTQYF